MRLCIVAKNMMRGGAERVIFQLIQYMLAQGHRVSLILVDDRPIQFDIPEACHVTVIGQQSPSAWKDKLLRYRQVRRTVKAHNCEIVLSMPEEIGIYVLPAMLGTGIPVVVSERNNPWVMPNKKITRILRKMVYPFADGLIFQTSFAASFFSEKLRKKGIILPNPLDLKRLPPEYTGQREKVIAGAGRLAPQKNFKLLIDGFSVFYQKHPDYRLVIYGEGSLREELTAYAARRLPEGICSFPGNVSDLPEHLNSVSAFVLSSDFEGMPNVLIEAMAMGVPCVSTDCPSGGPKELIENGVNGFLVPVGDAEALAQSLEKLVTETGVHPNAQEICRRFDSLIVAAQWEDYLKKILGRRKICR